MFLKDMHWNLDFLFFTFEIAIEVVIDFEHVLFI